MISSIRLLRLLLLILPATSAFSQSVQTPERRKELLERVLEEKHFHLPNKTAPSFESAAKTTSTTYDQKISANGIGTNEGEISVAYDPNDSSKIVLSFMKEVSGALSFPIYYSGDAGATWTLSSFNSANILNTDFPGQVAGGGGDPAFAWDKNGRVYFAWIYLSVPPTFDTGFFTLNWAYSDDNGHTWNVKPNHFIGRGAINPGTGTTYLYKDGITDREWLAVDNSTGPHQGNLYCSFVCFPADFTASTFEAIKVLKPGIDTFGNMVPAFTGSTQFGNVEVSKTGVLHMSFADLDNLKIRHVASNNGGVSFSTSQVVSPANTIFPTGTFVVHNRENAAINLATDGPTGTGNNVHIVWSDFPPGAVISYYAHSTDGGLTWSIPDTLNKRFHGHNTLMPTIAAFGSNVTISITAVDSVDSARYYLLNSTDNGNTFAAPFLISSAPTNYIAMGAPTSGSSLFFGDYNRSARSSCNVYSTWSDGRNNVDPKVYFAKKNYCTLGINEISSVTGNVQLVSLFPNPATDHITIQLNAGKAQSITIELLDMSGKKLATELVNLKGGSQQVAFPLISIAKGNYLISMQDNNGMIATRAIVVQ